MDSLNWVLNSSNTLRGGAISLDKKAEHFLSSLHEGPKGHLFILRNAPNLPVESARLDFIIGNIFSHASHITSERRYRRTIVVYFTTRKQQW